MKNSCTFSGALWKQYHLGQIAVIPDLKCRSPREGDLLGGRNPLNIAKTLVAAGAPVLSVVTEPKYFGGSLQLLHQVSRALSVPILRKDFITNVEQLHESVDCGASAVLLIAAMLETRQLSELFETALRLGLEPLVEVHNQAEIRKANELPLTMLGINNRDILQLEVDQGDMSTTEKLAELVRLEALIISESSVASAIDIKRAGAAGAHAVLVGTAILKAADPGQIYREFNAAGEIGL